jgi:hypothetical protein
MHYFNVRALALQFEYDILPGVMKMFKDVNLPSVKRGNPIEVARMMAAKVIINIK